LAFVVGSWPTKSRKEAAKAISNNAHLHTKFDIATFVDTSSSILALAFLALLIPAAFKIAAAPMDTTDHRLVQCNLQNISHATAIILILVYAGLLVFQLKTHTAEVSKYYEKKKYLKNFFLIQNFNLSGLR
jgi:calcium/proton exchanger cax